LYAYSSARTGRPRAQGHRHGAVQSLTDAKALRYLAVHARLTDDDLYGLPDAAAVRGQYIDAKVSLNSNLALACLSEKPVPPQKARQAIDAATAALAVEGEPTSDGQLRRPLQPAEKAKALYRRALAYNAVADADAALADLKAARALVPQDAAIERELATTKAATDAALAKKRKAMAKMFG
jgi:hypothetical protein